MGMDIAECFAWLHHQPNAVVRYFDKDGQRHIRVAAENEQESRVIVIIRPVTGKPSDAFVQAVIAAAEETVVQNRRSALRVV